MSDITLPPAGAGVTGQCTEGQREFVQEVEDTLNNGLNEGSTPVDIPDCADIYVEHEEPIIANHIIIGEFDPETMTSENMKVSPNGDLMTLSTLTGGVTEMPGVFRPDAVARAREIIGAYTPAEPATDTAPPAEDSVSPTSEGEGTPAASESTSPEDAARQERLQQLFDFYMQALREDLQRDLQRRAIIELLQEMMNNPPPPNPQML